MKNRKMIKTMNFKSCIAALLAVFILGMTTSCEDMFDITSNRVVYDHEINSTADSVYTTLGVLQCMRKVADRYILLGEVRGDMCDITEYTKTSLRNLANFNFDDENEYLNVRDYYAIINNCNYALAKMDTTLAINNQRVMLDEYAALQGIRAWTYLQLAINYGEVPYYTSPVVTEADVDKAYAEGKKDIKAITEDLAPRLIPYLDYSLPSFAQTQGGYPILRLVLADLYLWSGDYENAVKYLEEYFMKNKQRSYSVSEGVYVATQPGYFSLGGKILEWDGDDKLPMIDAVTGAEFYTSVLGDENIAHIEMAVSGDEGIASEVSSLFWPMDGKVSLNPSASWKSLSAQQMVFKYKELKNDKDTLYRTTKLGDMRAEPYLVISLTTNEITGEMEMTNVYEKHSLLYIQIYRRSIGYLRWAEALNALAKERHEVAADSAQLAEARKLAVNSFYLLKDASKVFFPDSSDVQKKFQFAETKYKKEFTGVHSRGAGDVERDSIYYVLTSEVVANRLGKNVTELTFNDTIEYIDNLIIDELALESTLEGNRFGDLIRFSKRRQAWGDAEYRDFLAKRVSERGGEEASAEERQALYEKLSNSEEYWFLPFK